MELRRALAAAALTAVTLTAVSLAVDHARPDADAELSTSGGLVPVPPGRTPDRAIPPAALGPTTAAAPGSAAQPPRPAPVPVGRNVVFVADYETGDFSQWGTCQSALVNSSCSTLPRGGDRAMQIVESATPDGGRYAAQFTVRDGDVPEFGGGERSEVSENDPDATTREGDERWYEWSMKLPQGVTRPTGGGWFIVMQWHSGSGSPPLAIDVSRGTVDIGGDGSGGGRQTIGPVHPDEWVNYVMHVKFSRNERTGFVEAWENGKQTVTRTPRATMSSDENYLKQGIYRDKNTRGATEVQFAGLRVTAP